MSSCSVTNLFHFYTSILTFTLCFFLYHMYFFHFGSVSFIVANRMTDALLFGTKRKLLIIMQCFCNWVLTYQNISSSWYILRFVCLWKTNDTCELLFGRRFECKKKIQLSLPDAKSMYIFLAIVYSPFNTFLPLDLLLKLFFRPPHQQDVEYTTNNTKFIPAATYVKGTSHEELFFPPLPSPRSASFQCQIPTTKTSIQFTFNLWLLAESWIPVTFNLYS